MSEVFEFSHFFIFPYQLVYLHCVHGLLRTLSFHCVFIGQLSDFLSSDCLIVFPFFVFRFVLFVVVVVFLFFFWGGGRGGRGAR